MWRKKEDTSDRNRPKVFVGLSGGVDSAVSAALLKEQGYDVTGVFIKGWQPDWMRGAVCSWREERRDAMRVALHLGIPFVSLDCEKEYKESVVDKMLAEYRAGRTPNPDVLCNREIKFGVFWEKAKALGADFIATGHYASIGRKSTEVFSAENLPGARPVDLRDPFPTQYLLCEGRDRAKDQSYFLWTLTQEDLAHTLFPVGHLEKREVRRLAEKFKLPVAEKKDSQGICFLGMVEMEDFLSRFIESKPGEVLNLKGEVVGNHRGAIFYTIGERHGFEIYKKGPNEGAHYVVSKDLEKNTITVSNEEREITSVSPKEVVLTHLNLIHKPDDSKPLRARIRYRGEKLLVEFNQESKRVSFDKPVRGLSLGQSLVFYQDEECLGGGVIDREVS